MKKTKRIAVIGGGGREHAIAWKLGKDIGQENVFVLPGNAGIPNSHRVPTDDFAAIKTFCESRDIHWIFVGPEQPLAEGIVDYFSGTDIHVLGPTAKAAQLEASKVFAKDFMKKYRVATAPYRKFEHVQDAHRYISEQKSGFVIKFDGLAGGKGVFVCENESEGRAALNILAEKYGERVPFIIEEKITGDEISIIGFTDGEHIRLLQPSQDHKQLLEGDRGPNTGGMGAYCPVPGWNERLTKMVERDIIVPTLRGLRYEKMNYKGIIYFGIMVTANAAFLLEYNVRLGDPETEVLLPSLKSSLADLMEATLTGNLAQTPVEFEKGYFADVVLVSGGYPGAYDKGYPLTIHDGMDEGVMLFHAGVDVQRNQLVTAGGRVLNVVAHGNTLEEALKSAYDNVEKIDFKDMYFRRDIGKRRNVWIRDGRLGV